MPTKNLTTHPAIQYLKALFSENDIVCLTFIHATRKYPGTNSAITVNLFCPVTQPASNLGAALLNRINDEFHVYVSMAPFKHGSRNRTKANVAEVRHVFIEADENGDAVLAAMRESVAKCEIPKPMIIVQSSPHKYQFIWNVTGFTISEQEALNRTLQQKFGGDPQATDAARVLRIPGFRNLKPKYGDPKPVAEIIEYNEPPFMGITIHDFNIPMTSEPDNTVHPVASDAVVQQSIDFLEAALNEASVSYTRKVWEGSGGAYKFPLALCPWRENHENGGVSDAMAIVQPSGAFGFKCLHAHCADKHWKDFRTHLESLAGHKLTFTSKDKPKPSVDSPMPVESPVATTESTAESTLESTCELLLTPRYPVEVWDGTLFRECADLCRSNNHLPLEFFIESLKTIVGAICGHRITPVDNPGQESRFFTTIMSEHTGDGKSESSKWMMQMMIATGLLYDSELPALDLKNIGAYRDTFASGRGMVEAYFLHSRILQWYDELSVMVEKFGISGSGASFMGLQTDMFESNLPPRSRIGGTAPRPVAAPKTCHASVLACTVKKKRDVMYTNTGAENSGWFPRENLVVTGEVELVAMLHIPALAEIGEKLKTKILPLEYRCLRVSFLPAAQKMMDEWFLEMRQRTKDEADDVWGRLNVMVQRNASMLAWLLSKDESDHTLCDVGGDSAVYATEEAHAEVTEDIARRAILLAEYTLSVRRANQPIAGDNQYAKCENIIKKHLCQRTRTSRRILYREANLSRFGTKIVNNSLINLIQGGLVTIWNKPDGTSDELALRLPGTTFLWMGDGRRKDQGWKELRGGDRRSPYFKPRDEPVKTEFDCTGTKMSPSKT
jgi:RepB DNA-primase from phage plasmid